MGRNLIATKDDSILIVQCKYWSQHKLIHEKHIAQLYGTTIQYKLASETGRSVIPVFVTNISLSETAKVFARHLGVKVVIRELEDFPRIKCNIGKDEFGYSTKIYHLPMDQQYDRTKISSKGDFMAHTVKEAVDSGFRRAWRWHGDG